VRELSGPRVGLDMEIELSAGAQEIKGPAGGATVQLEGMRGTGSGTLDLDLTRLVPRRGHTTLDSNLSMKVPTAGQTISMSSRMKMVMDMRAGR
jgi:hypothetical protein